MVLCLVELVGLLVQLVRNSRLLQLTTALSVLFSLSGCLAAVPAGALAVGLWVTRDEPSKVPVAQDSRPTPDGNTAEITLNWDANAEPDLAGYRIYYRKGSTGPPYDGKGANEGDSPISIGKVTTFRLTGLSYGARYCFAITAYDLSGKESGYSGEVCFDTGVEPGAGSGPQTKAWRVFWCGGCRYVITG